MEPSSSGVGRRRLSGQGFRRTVSGPVQDAAFGAPGRFELAAARLGSLPARGAGQMHVTSNDGVREETLHPCPLGAPANYGGAGLSNGGCGLLGDDSAELRRREDGSVIIDLLNGDN